MTAASCRLAAALLCAIILSSAARGQTPDDTSPLIDLGPVIEGLVNGGEDRPADAPQAEPRVQARPLGTPADEAERTRDGTQDGAGAPPRPAVLARLRLLDSGSSLVTRVEDDVVRLSGERSSARFAIDLTAPPPDPSLVLSYRNSINVLPQDSEIIVSINGTETATLPANAFDDFRSARVDAPGLVAGSNVITVEVIQRHRIFCGVEASFQIWTEIDLDQSGVPLRAGTREDGGPSLEAALASLGGGAPLRLRAAPSADPAVVDALAARLAPAAGGLVEIGSAFDPVVGGAGEPRVVIEGGGSSSARLVLGGDGAVVLRVVHGPSGDDPAAALPDLSSLLDPAGDDPLTEAVPTVRPGIPVQLSTLGFEQRNEIASFFRETLTLRLPVDWLALSNQKAVLFLDYGFAEGLPEGARLLVKVNGTTVRLLPLDRGGGMQPTLDVGFLASLLGPGSNRLAFEVIIEAENPQFACPPWPTRILTISPDSVLAIPQMPRMHFDGMEWALPSLSSSGVQFGRGDRIGSGGLRPVERERFASLMVPERDEYLSEPPENVTLTVLTIDEFWPGVTGGLEIGRSAMLAVLAPPFQTPAPEPAGAEIADVEDTDTLAEAIQRVRAAGAWVRGLAVPGGPPLDEWLRGRSAEAMLLQPEEDAPQNLVLVLSPTAEPLEVARAIVDDRLALDGPRGRVALLGEDGTWASWRPPFDPPRLDEPLTPWNMRAVLGNYASWLPLGFTGGLLLLTLLSAYIALLFVVKTREPNQR